ncbi:MAG: pirin family protein [Bacteroidota bacterium]
MASKQILKIQKIGFQWEMESPFLFCAHHKDNYPEGNKEQGIAESLSGRNIGSDFSGKDGFSMYHGETVPGFPVHPHRGFETVTIILKGLVDHFDSKGSKGRYGNGDVQWLTTGSGCQHAEMFPLINQDQGNPAELFQIWLNLPAKDKFTEPAYKMLWSEDIPEIRIEGNRGGNSTVKLISGSIQGRSGLEPCPASWANDKQNHVGIFLFHMKPGAAITLPSVSDTLVRNLYFYEGAGVIKIQDEAIPSSNRVKLSGNEEISLTNGDKESFLLLLEGKPIREAVAQYGPFVMTTEQEVRDAFADFRKTEFGGWPWDRPDPVNEITAGRFARHADGTTESR